MSNHITPEHLEQYTKAFNSDRSSRVACDAVTSNGLLKSCTGFHNQSNTKRPLLALCCNQCHAFPYYRKISSGKF